MERNHWAAGSSAKIKVLPSKRVKNKSEWNKPSEQEFRRQAKEEIRANSTSSLIRKNDNNGKKFLEGEGKIDKPENGGDKKIK